MLCLVSLLDIGSLIYRNNVSLNQLAGYLALSLGPGVVHWELGYIVKYRVEYIW